LAATPVFGHGPHETGSESNDGGGFVIGTGIYNVEETSVHAKSKCFHVIFQVVKEDGGGAKNRENLKEFDTVGCVQNPVERLHPLHFFGEGFFKEVPLLGKDYRSPVVVSCRRR
jgi:hypothetical protein